MKPTRSQKNAMGCAVSDGLRSSIQPCFGLHKYQRQVLRDIMAAVASEEPRVVAHVPTGGGKTRIAAHAACELLNKREDESSLLIWLAATEELCEQAAEQLARAWKHLGTREIALHRHWGGSQLDLQDLRPGFLITGLAKLRSASDSDNTLLSRLALRTAGVVFDEAHQVVASTYEHLVEQLCSNRPPLIGLTATPGRSADMTDEDYKLARMFYQKKATIDPQGHGNPVTFLIANRYLADPEIISIAFDANDDIMQAAPGTDYSDDVLRVLGENDSRRQEILRLVTDATRRHSRILVFCPSVDCAHACADDLAMTGILSDVITTKTSEQDRRAAIQSFKADDRSRRVLLNFGVLTTGFDAPKTSCVIIARPTTSLVLYSQMMGRAMRGPRANGNRRASILTIVDTNLPGFASVADAFTHWEALWAHS